MTGCNWQPAFGEDPRVGKQLFCLLRDIWPAHLPIEYDANLIDTHVKELFKQLRYLKKSCDQDL